MRLKTYFGDVKYINPSKTPRPTHRRKFKVFKKTFHITGQGRTRHGGGAMVLVAPPGLTKRRTL